MKNMIKTFGIFAVLGLAVACDDDVIISNGADEKETSNEESKETTTNEGNTNDEKEFNGEATDTIPSVINDSKTLVISYGMMDKSNDTINVKKDEDEGYFSLETLYHADTKRYIFKGWDVENEIKKYFEPVYLNDTVYAGNDTINIKAVFYDEPLAIYTEDGMIYSTYKRKITDLKIPKLAACVNTNNTLNVNDIATALNKLNYAGSCNDVTQKLPFKYDSYTYIYVFVEDNYSDDNALTENDLRSDIYVIQGGKLKVIPIF